MSVAVFCNFLCECVGCFKYNCVIEFTEDANFLSQPMNIKTLKRIKQKHHNLKLIKGIVTDITLEH